MNDYYGTENYGPAGPPEGNKSSATTEPELIADARYARAVANQGKQVTALSMRCAELESERAALEAENARLREALADIKQSASAYAASVELQRIIPAMTEATSEHGMLTGMTTAAEIARRALDDAP